MGSKAKDVAGALGCLLPVVLVVVAAGIGIVLGGRHLITQEAVALCGSQEMEEGEVCESHSRNTGKTLDSFGAGEAKDQQDTASDALGWVLVAVGGVIALAPVGVAGSVLKEELGDRRQERRRRRPCPRRTV